MIINYSIFLQVYAAVVIIVVRLILLIPFTLAVESGRSLLGRRAVRHTLRLAPLIPTAATLAVVLLHVSLVLHLSLLLHVSLQVSTTFVVVTATT